MATAQPSVDDQVLAKGHGTLTLYPLPGTCIGGGSGLGLGLGGAGITQFVLVGAGSGMDTPVLGEVLVRKYLSLNSQWLLTMAQ